MKHVFDGPCRTRGEEVVGLTGCVGSCRGDVDADDACGWRSVGRK